MTRQIFQSVIRSHGEISRLIARSQLELRHREIEVELRTPLVLQRLLQEARSDALAVQEPEVRGLHHGKAHIGAAECWALAEESDISRGSLVRLGAPPKRPGLLGRGADASFHQIAPPWHDDQTVQRHAGDDGHGECREATPHRR
jgi:hypothetical protein